MLVTRVLTRLITPKTFTLCDVRSKPFLVAPEHPHAREFCTEVPQEVLTSVRKPRGCSVLSVGELVWSARKEGFSSSDAACQLVWAVPQILKFQPGVFSG